MYKYVSIDNISKRDLRNYCNIFPSIKKIIMSMSTGVPRKAEGAYPINGPGSCIRPNVSGVWIAQILLFLCMCYFVYVMLFST